MQAVGRAVGAHGKEPYSWRTVREKSLRRTGGSGVGRLSIGRFIMQFVGVFGGLCRGVGFHLADHDVLTDERKEQQLDVEAVAVAMFPSCADVLPQALVGVR